MERRAPKRRRSRSDGSDTDDEVSRDSQFSKFGSPSERSIHSNKPAEMFRKDLISAMKLPDSQQLQPEEFLVMTDTWKQEWERGVQVPVNPDMFPHPTMKEIVPREKQGCFKMPRKLLKLSAPEKDSEGSVTLQLADNTCRYDLDDTDLHWLTVVNTEREVAGDTVIDEYTMERIIEELENKCHENKQLTIETEEGLGIEYDEDVICDVCRSPDCEEGNEMVFCDSCNICVHQACYGIQKIPEGSWVCRTCALGISPTCLLCPKKAGAMKSTRSGTKWCHVSCALWVPEVSIGVPEKMEPVCKISQIPPSRWDLICCLCRERTGAPIQCVVTTCKVAFHVTCAFQNGLEMKTVLEGPDEEVKFKSYCPKHTKKRQGVTDGASETTVRPSSTLSPKKKTEEEKRNERADRLERLEEEFYTLVSPGEISTSLEQPEDVVDVVCEYWKLKRKANFNRPLVMPKTEEADLLSQAEEDSLYRRLKMFMHLRQDLERVRNLCYMVGKREKLKRQQCRVAEEVFYKTLKVVEDEWEDLDISTLPLRDPKPEIISEQHSTEEPMEEELASNSQVEEQKDSESPRNGLSIQMELLRGSADKGKAKYSSKHRSRDRANGRFLPQHEVTKRKLDEYIASIDTTPKKGRSPNHSSPTSVSGHQEGRRTSPNVKGKSGSPPIKASRSPSRRSSPKYKNDTRSSPPSRESSRFSPSAREVKRSPPALERRTSPRTSPKVKESNSPKSDALSPSHYKSSRSEDGKKSYKESAPRISLSNLSGYRIPKKTSPNAVNKAKIEQKPVKSPLSQSPLKDRQERPMRFGDRGRDGYRRLPLSTSPTQLSKKRMDGHFNQTSGTHLQFDNVDGEVSLRRSTSPTGSNESGPTPKKYPTVVIDSDSDNEIDVEHNSDSESTTGLSHANRLSRYGQNLPHRSPNRSLHNSPGMRNSPLSRGSPNARLNSSPGNLSKPKSIKNRITDAVSRFWNSGS
ncbi:protein Jade-3-like isoform X3 [Branchiostoma floridae]|uniref:Protein Jade-3-like isoform X3 n=1 Tax=Branchiostoma floridae TaxID=7739 RepID=A0A9J7LHD4_BRAFL|nr:protein Jade-3-like isoform X3 [Branchiostoma floridae]